MKVALCHESVVILCISFDSFSTKGKEAALALE
jgi:hypothetical protein